MQTPFQWPGNWPGAQSPFAFLAPPNVAQLGNQFSQQLGFFNELFRTSSESARRLATLNFQLPQQLLEDAINTGHGVLSSGDPYQLSAMLIKQTLASMQHLNNYNEQLLNVIAGVQTTLSQELVPASVAFATAAGYVPPSPV